MIVLDANLLLYAYDKESPHYAKSRPWIERTFSGSEAVGLPWQTIAAFVRVATNVRLLRGRIPATRVMELVEEWLAQPNVRVLTPGDNHWPLFRRMILEGQAFGPLASDAQLAALTMENGGILYTADRDFARFPGLRWINPLA
jgi:hypothetical protein